MISGRWFITPHAVRRYIERCCPDMDYDQARRHLAETSLRAHHVRDTSRGQLWRGPSPERLRLLVGPGDGELPALVTVLAGHDGARPPPRRVMVLDPGTVRAPHPAMRPSISLGASLGHLLASQVPEAITLACERLRPILRDCGGNLLHAAHRSGIPHRTLCRWLADYPEVAREVDDARRARVA